MEKFSWLPFFEEVLNKICIKYDKKSLCKETHKIFNGCSGLSDKDKKGQTFPLKEIDPLSFIALFNKKHTIENKKIFFDRAKLILNLDSNVPVDVDGIPQFDNRNALFFPYQSKREDHIIDELWTFSKYFNIHNTYTQEYFDKLLSPIFPQIALAKLSQFLFICKPDLYFPADKKSLAYAKDKGYTKVNPKDFKSYEQYVLDLKVNSKESYPYHFSLKAYENSKKKSKLISLTANPDQEEFDLQYEIQYQRDVENVQLSESEINEANVNSNLPELKELNGNKYWKRDPKKAKEALKKVNFYCEIDAKHKTFESKYSKENFVEAHHLIPMSCQGNFKDISLDILSNIIALCPNCHRAIHNSEQNFQKKLIKQLFDNRYEQLIKQGISIKFEDLLELYQ